MRTQVFSHVFLLCVVAGVVVHRDIEAHAIALHLEHEIRSIAAGKKADFMVLEDDPLELGVDRLKDVRVAGTVFEGEVHLMVNSVASVLQGDEAMAGGPARRGRASRSRYRKEHPALLEIQGVKVACHAVEEGRI